MKSVVFDLEITRIIPPDCTDWWSLGKLGVSCAVAQLGDSKDAIVWAGWDDLSEGGSKSVVRALLGLVSDGYTLVGFNSLGFDLRCLAAESGLVDECRWLALNHVDLFFHLFCALGNGPGLDRLAKGLGLSGKTAGMNGAKAPEMWAQGERQKVIEYCVQDVRTTAEIYRLGNELNGVEWQSKAGNVIAVSFDKWLPVLEASSLPEPDVSWMTNPWSRDKLLGWMTE